ncbi:purine-cytosine permease family protein [Burkholderia anthina]|uniref:Allantoin permease n=1 Tax=Burkholderia anthina TaxID=179879 RepID=A0A7T6VLF0_9BURK|nr:allantoin permease [Burkholderia anthina]MBY4869701.1 allantoin permease [Burkholderia anthina]QQK05906.1 allantoin permease [Burkholderia anthina]
MPGMLVQEAASEEDLSTERVGIKGRMPKLSLTMAWWSLCSTMVPIVIGATLALHFGALNAIIGMLLSVVVYSSANYVISRFALRTGLSVALFSRVLFGRVGALLATLIFAVTVIYYTVFETSVMAVAVNTLFPKISFQIAALLVIVYSVPLVFGSVQHWLDKLNGILLPFYIFGLFAAVAMATYEYGYNPNWIDFGAGRNGSANGWWDCFVAYMGVWTFMMAAFDFARFGRKEDERYHALFNFGAPFWVMTLVINGVIGIYLVSAIPTSGPLSELSVVMALLKLMGIGGFLFLWITQTRINTANYYLATVNTHAFFEKALGLKLPKFVWAIVVGVIVYALTLSGLFANLLKALQYQGVFVVAWVAIALTHIISTRYEDPFGGDDEAIEAVPAFNVIGLSAWFVAAAAGIIVMNQPPNISGSSAPVTFVVAAIAYRFLTTYSRRAVQAGQV